MMWTHWTSSPASIDCITKLFQSVHWKTRPLILFGLGADGHFLLAVACQAIAIRAGHRYGAGEKRLVIAKPYKIFSKLTSSSRMLISRHWGDQAWLHQGHR